jgi:hypothetical protein
MTHLLGLKEKDRPMAGNEKGDVSEVIPPEMPFFRRRGRSE